MIDFFNKHDGHKPVIVPFVPTAENVSKKWNISRKEQDEFALSSQVKAEKAKQQGNKTENGKMMFIIKHTNHSLYGIK